MIDIHGERINRLGWPSQVGDQALGVDVIGAVMGKQFHQDIQPCDWQLALRSGMAASPLKWLGGGCAG